MTITIPAWALFSLLIVGSIGVLLWGTSSRSSGLGDLGGAVQALLSIIIVLMIWMLYFAFT